MALTLLNSTRHGRKCGDFELFSGIQKCFEDVRLTVLVDIPLASAAGCFGSDNKGKRIIINGNRPSRQNFAPLFGPMEREFL